MERRRRKNVIIILLSVVLLMSIGFAAFSTNLKIMGSARVVNSCDVKITNIALKPSSLDKANPYGTAGSPATNPGGAVNPTYTDTTATFYSTLGVPGDSVTYVVTIVNNGSVNATFDDILWVKDDGMVDTQYNASPIIYTYSFPNKNQVFAQNGGTTTLEVTVIYDENATEQPNDSLLEKSATLLTNYV